MWWHLGGYLLRLCSGVLLVCFTVAALLVILAQLFRRPEVENGVILLGILLAVLWWLWSRLPDCFRNLVRKSLRRKEHGNGR